MNPSFKNHLLNALQATDCQEVEVIQSLWSGYGKISRYDLDGSKEKTVVVKCIALNDATHHPRGWHTSLSHERKTKSYEIETNWYKHWAHKCSDNCKVPRFLGAFEQGNNQWIIMEDLNNGFPQRKTHLSLSELERCLQWLAHFHATFLGEKPTELWPIGTYWHLATRPDELAKMEHKALQKKAGAIDAMLNKCNYQTIVHGDAKLANFCFSSVGQKVAAVDFQYVGGGCGIKDVAYFLGSALSGKACEQHVSKLLDYYFRELRSALLAKDKDVDANALESEWRKMYPIACADFTRFLLGWMPTHQKVNDYNMRLVEDVLGSI